MNRNKQQLLKQITKTIVKAVHPRQIILFGSYATKSAGPNSDLDLIIVEDLPFNKKRSRRREMTRLWEVLSSFAIPKDILLYSTQEISKWKNTKNHIIARALKEGIVLYDRA